MAQGETISKAVAANHRGRRAWPFIALGLVAAAGLGVWFWIGQAPQRPDYATAQIGKGTVSRSVTASGTVNPVLTVTVGSYVSGVIQEITCDYNTRVHKGQVCARIDPRPYQVVVDQDQAALETARAQLVKDQAALEYAALNHQRLARLLTQDSTSRDTVDVARSAWDQAKAQVALDQASVRQHEAALNAANVNLSYTTIVSPLNGTVVSRNVNQGQTVAASFSTPTLFLIAQDLTQMQVDTNISESDIEGEGRAIKAGDGAVFTVEAFPNHPFHGQVAQVRQAPQTVQNVVTYDVVVGVNNNELLLRPGMTATVKIVTDQRDNVLRAPNQALRYSPTVLKAKAGEGQAGASDRVWVLRDGKPVAVPVQIGLEDDAFTEIRGGALQTGDQVILTETQAKGKKAATKTPMPRF
ncbi:MAG: efflux RND transporter periplasmic adaptor subunit [Caulobacteraceae bacterium]|nr:efflux RND transporter periplasmic adaptor subunit [Caulobacteraceae bacterium]